MGYSFILQVSLILELCSLGNLRNFLIVHKNEFLTGFEQVSTRGLSTNKSNAPKYGAHSLFLWSYQVSFIYNVTQETIVVIIICRNRKFNYYFNITDSQRHGISKPTQYIPWRSSSQEYIVNRRSGGQSSRLWTFQKVILVALLFAW